MMADSLLEVRNLSVWYPIHGGTFSRIQKWVKAVRGVDLHVAPGEIVAIVGESGCGKTTLAQALVGLREWQSGTLVLNGGEVQVNKATAWKSLRTQVQLVFQDPFSSLNPRQTLEELLLGPQKANGISALDARARAIQALEQVGMDAADLEKFPHAFSGGQRQRIGIARALALQSRLLICDEPTSALDVSVQAQILQLLQELRQRLGLSILIISHDLSVVASLADRVMVMYLGSLVEILPAKGLFQKALHPYTKALLSAVPTLDCAKAPQTMRGEIPSLSDLPAGCVFASRCPVAKQECERSEPPFVLFENGCGVRCPFAKDLA